MRVVLVGASPERLSLSQARRLKASAAAADFVVAVDGGLNLLRRHRIRPSLYVGDLDSTGVAGARLPKTLPCVFLPRDKDYSDLRAALEICRGLGAGSIEAWGVLGGRMDHHWAALEDLTDADWVQELSANGIADCHWVRAGSPLVVSGVARGTTVSIFALRGRAQGVTTGGLKYGLRSESLPPGSRGLSNLATHSRIRVSVGRGRLLVMVGQNG